MEMATYITSSHESNLKKREEKDIIRVIYKIFYCDYNFEKKYKQSHCVSLFNMVVILEEKLYTFRRSGQIAQL